MPGRRVESICDSDEWKSCRRNVRNVGLEVSALSAMIAGSTYHLEEQVGVGIPFAMARKPIRANPAPCARRILLCMFPIEA